MHQYFLIFLSKIEKKTRNIVLKFFRARQPLDDGPRLIESFIETSVG